MVLTMIDLENRKKERERDIEWVREGEMFRRLGFRNKKENLKNVNGLSASGIYNPDFMFRNMGFMFRNMPHWNIGFEIMTEHVSKCNSLDNRFRNMGHVSKYSSLETKF